MSTDKVGDDLKMKTISVRSLASIGFTCVVLSSCHTAPSSKASDIHVNTLSSEKITRTQPILSSSMKINEKKLSGELTLEDAVSLSLVYSPELQVYSTEVRIKEALALQARLFPNPELEGEVEEFGGTGPRKGFTSAESTIKVSQLIEMGGKRGKRAAIGRYDKDLAQWDFESKKLDVIEKTKVAFIDLLLFQEKLKISEHLNTLATELHGTIEEKVQAGKVAPLEGKKARIALSFSKLEMEKNQRELSIAHQRLKSLWGDLKVKIQKVSGKLDVSQLPVALQHTFEDAQANPEILRLKIEAERSKAVSQLERASRIPDITLSAGVKHFEETKDEAFVVGLSIPLPLFDRNQGNVSAAKEEERKVQELSLLAKTRIESDLLQLNQETSLVYSEVRALEDDILPNAESSFADSKEAYLRGKVDYLDLLDSQRTLFEVKVKHMEALGNYHKLHARIDRLIGGALNESTEK